MSFELAGGRTRKGENRALFIFNTPKNLLPTIDKKPSHFQVIANAWKYLTEKKLVRQRVGPLRSAVAKWKISAHVSAIGI